MIEFILGSLLLFYIIYSSFSKPKGYPPGPFRVPLIGYAQSVDTQHPYKTWNKLRKVYGDVLGLYMGFQRTIIVNGWDAVKEGLYNEDINDRPYNIILRDTFNGQDLGIMFTNHELWQVQRRFSLFHLKNLGFGKRSHEAVILEELTDVIQEFKETNNKSFSVQTPLGVSAINILWSIVGGERFSRNDEKLKVLVSSLNKAFRAGEAFGGVLAAFPPLRHVLPNISGYKTIMEGFTGTKGFVMRYINERKSSFDANNPRDFIDVYLTEIEKENRDKSFTYDQLAGTCIDLFSAGTETGSSLISFAIMFLCLHPEEQSKVQEEIDAIVGKDRLPNMDDKLKLIKTEAFIQEVLRIRCPAPHTVPHWSRVDTKLQGYRIPKDSVVLFNIRSVLMDESYWGDPEVFRPDRFVEKGSLMKYERMIPFGKGRRACLGESLARMTSYLTFSALVQNFTFTFAPGELCQNTEGITGFTLGAPPFNVIASPR